MGGSREALWLQAVRMSAGDWLSERLLALGQRAIVEEASWSRAERDHLREGARRLGAGVELHVLETPVALPAGAREQAGLEQRHGSRALTRDDLETCVTMFHPSDATELALYDERADVG